MTAGSGSTSHAWDADMIGHYGSSVYRGRGRKRMEKDVRPEVRKIMEDVGKLIAEAMPDTHGFALLVFDWGDEGYLNYISNANRADMIKALKEMTLKLESEGRGRH